MSTLPVPPSTISTPRLRLVRLTDTEPGSRHVQWFHENWSDPVATGWRYRPHIPHPSSYAIRHYPVPMLLALKYSSLHGATKSLEESRLFMVEHLRKWDNWFYAVFVRPTSGPEDCNPNDGNDDDDDDRGLGTHVGSVSLRLPPVGLELPPPASFEGAAEVGSGNPLSEDEVKRREDAVSSVKIQLRTLGYALFASAHGRGYATEACKALLDGYAASIQEWKAGAGARGDDGAKTRFYVEAGVDQENPGSQRVLRKLGFRTVGLKVEKEKVWLNGAWRGPGWWITGLYL